MCIYPCSTLLGAGVQHQGLHFINAHHCYTEKLLKKQFPPCSVIVWPGKSLCKHISPSLNNITHVVFCAHSPHRTLLCTQVPHRASHRQTWHLRPSASPPALEDPSSLRQGRRGRSKLLQWWAACQVSVSVALGSRCLACGVEHGAEDGFRRVTISSLSQQDIRNRNVFRSNGSIWYSIIKFLICSWSGASS